MSDGIERRHIVGVGDVDCFAYVGQPGWHGKGQRVIPMLPEGEIDVADMERFAYIGWNVIEAPVFAQGPSGQMLAIKGAKALVRDEDHHGLSVVTKRYGTIQHRALGAILDRLVKLGVGTWETAGSIDDGRRLFYNVKLNASLEAMPNDETKLHVVATTSHDGSATAEFLLTAIRVVCQNTLSMAMSNNVQRLTVRHMGDVDKALEEAEQFVGQLNQNIDRLDGALTQFTKIIVTEKAAQRFLDRVVPLPALPPPDRIDALPKSAGEKLLERITYERDLAARVQDKIKELHEAGEGAEISGVKGTAYGWLNATTNYATHIMKSKAKVESVLVGDAARLGRRAFSALADEESRGQILEDVD
jgi:phage/plasmid-like protein (TIGR03299 family)